MVTSSIVVNMGENVLHQFLNDPITTTCGLILWVLFNCGHYHRFRPHSLCTLHEMSSLQTIMLGFVFTGEHPHQHQLILDLVEANDMEAIPANGADGRRDIPTIVDIRRW